jgi:hypothetical protein
MLNGIRQRPQGSRLDLRHDQLIVSNVVVARASGLEVRSLLYHESIKRHGCMQASEAAWSTGLYAFLHAIWAS